MPTVATGLVYLILILLNIEKDLTPEQLVTIKLRNKASRGCIN